MSDELPPPPPPRKKQKRHLSLSEFMEQIERSPLLSEVPRAQDPKELRMSGGYRSLKAHTHPAPNTGNTNDNELAERLKEIEAKEQALMQREQTLAEQDIKLQNRERDLWEDEALLTAKKKSFEAQSRTSFKKDAGEDTGQDVYTDEQISAANNAAGKALQQLQTELEAKQKELAQQASMLDEREKFLEDSENTLMEKGMVLQELETALQQKEDDLKKWEKRLKGEPVPEEKKEKL